MRQIVGDLVLAFGLLTRLPLPSLELDPHRSADAAWSWPLVGAVVGAIGAAVGAAAEAFGLPIPVAAGIALAAMAMATGGLHEDGLADTADGLWGGATRERRLEIMRDSRIGAYGVLALGIVLILRWSAVSSVDWWALIGAAALARAGMAGLMAALPAARQDGLSRATGRPSLYSVAIAGLIGVAVAIVTLPKLMLVIVVTLILLGWLGTSAKAKIGGQTGDILGAGSILVETAALIVSTAA